MFLEISARPNPGLTVAALRHGLRRQVLLARVAGWALLGLAALRRMGGGGLNVTLLLAGVALAVVVPMALLNSGARRARREEGPTTFEISDGGVAWSTLESRHSYAWNAFTRVDRLAGQLVFGLGSARFVQVPTGGLTPAQIGEVLATATAHGVAVTRAA